MTRNTSLVARAAGLAMLSLVLLAGSVSANHFTTFSTTLDGAEEAPGPGDPNGKGWITLDVFTSGTICFDAKVQAIAGAHAGHIHRAPAGSAGPVVVDLRLDLATRQGPKIDYCVSTTPAQAAAIVASPTDYYVNIHNDDYPGGAIRGQLGD